MNGPRRWYSLFLVVHDDFLVEMAGVLGAAYVPGSFDQSVTDLHETDEWEAEFQLRGPFGRFIVHIERHEGYLACALSGDEPQFQAGKELMWKRYLEAGGDPEVARSP